MYVVELSKYIITKCFEEGVPISNLQLQKILYYIQKEYLHKKGECAFREVIEAWQFGPVVPEAYYRFSDFGAMPITMKYGYMPINQEDKVLIDSIIESKRVLNPWELVEDTHKPDGAWSKVYNAGAGKHQTISHQLIQAET